MGGLRPLGRVYAEEPGPVELAAEQAAHILGAQANIWTEYLADSDSVEYMLMPRLLALSEVVWSQKSLRSFADFSRRVVPHYDRLAAAAVHFRLPPPAALGGEKMISRP